ncbi:MAG: BON domain-containing protein [Bryobacteraceae bacterium]|nr:BON domain-containing protein [Bryobacteraceae bacterium]
MTAAAQSERTEPDNTRVNKNAEPTADDATGNKSDRETMRAIRRSIVKDDSLSTTAQNVKVIAKNGKVTLKGPVNSEQEKQAIHAKAVEIAGEGKVVNEITVKQANGRTSRDR